MSLRDLSLRYQYRPNQGNMVEEFYIPCLASASLYQRAVGYFTSNSLSLAARGISTFAGHGGKMQLVVSPKLDDEDVLAIQEGYSAREDVVSKALLRELNLASHDFVKQRLGALAWLIAQERLDIKIAEVNDPARKGFYHEKIGLFEDQDKNTVAFSGSSNETSGGLWDNFETLEVYCSWRDGDGIRVENKRTDFNDLWNNTTHGLLVRPFPDAVRERLIEFQQHFRPGTADPEAPGVRPMVQITRQLRQISVPEGMDVRPYQQEAIKSWFRQNGSGILEMATGTGKTITSLTASVKLFEVKKRLGLFIVAPYTHLVDQWDGEARKFGWEPILAYESRQRWEEDVFATLTAYQTGAIDHYCILTTTRTLMSPTMQEALQRLTEPAMLIADEAHHLGAQNLRKALPTNIPYRLALSATPERWYDDEGSDALKEFFAPGVIFQYGLKEAIEAGFLTRYFYYPHVVELGEEEYQEYRTITKKIVKLVAGGKLDVEDERVQYLLIQRARLINRAEAKFERLRELVGSLRDSAYNLFYCGDAAVDGERQVDMVTRILGQDLGMKVHPFTSQETLSERQELLHMFDQGRLQGLVAIRCLDEGVDVPATQTAFILASSTNPREFIQRRGRILRRHPQKQFATIHDFFVTPSDPKSAEANDPECFNMERKLVRRELARVLEFASLAENGPQAHLALLPLKKAYNLLDM